MDKSLILNKLIDILEEEITRLSNSYNTSRELSVEAPNRMQSRYDTTGIEAAWLADGIAKKIEERKKDLSVLKSISNLPKDCNTIGIFSLVTVLEENKNRIVNYFLVPVAGGIKIELDGQVIISVNKDAPIAKEMIGKSVGDIFDLNNNLCKIVDVK